MRNAVSFTILGATGFWVALTWTAGFGAAAGLAAEATVREQALAGLRRGVEFFRRDVAVEGTYLWQYSEDLAKREGEGKATATQGWVQPPGTPAVGSALLDAHAATGDEYYLDAVRETAHGLARGQLQSGGWAYFIDFNPQTSRPLAYRLGGSTSKKARNHSTLDDNTTQAALLFLMHADRALKFEDGRVHEAARCALESVLRAQYPNGAWPQGYDRPPEPDKFPVKKAAFPERWSRTHLGGDYHRFYTFNDDVIGDVVEMLFAAWRIYREPGAPADMRPLADGARAAAEKAGDFILLAQLPDPQPAWAQQYDFDMHPAWARKFEPPAVCGGESQGVLRTLLSLYRQTGNRKYLEPIPRAIQYFQRSRRPDGRLARFYELQTNRPLYFTKDYQLTYDDGDVPTHYAFAVGDGTAAIARELERVSRLNAAELAETLRPARPKADRGLEKAVRSLLAAQDARGRWVEDGRLHYHGADDPTTRVIRCETFIRHVRTLSRYLEATRPQPK
jgi:PelA/Pel-15E family pectate lyase